MRTTITDACIRSMTVMASGDLDDLAQVVHPEATNREAKDEPPACRGQGPAAFAATAHWLRAAFADLAFDIHDTVADGDLIALHCTMSGRQVGPFVSYDEQGEVAGVMPPTGRRFAVTHTHWFRIRDGLVVEHWANRDDFGLATQLGWVPPTPAYLVRMAWAKARTKKSIRSRNKPPVEIGA